MSRGRLTRQELSWLLTQEAQNAAERLRVGVQVLRTQSPTPMPTPPAAALTSAGVSLHHAEDPAHHVDASLDALDDVMRMLSNLNQRSSSATGGAARRGRIDIAALLWEIAPDARVSIEPGSGTEVYGEEADFRRMLQVLIGHGSGEGALVTLRRDGDVVRVSVVLGPDSSPTAETERAWLNRMALRYGGRHELEGGTESLVLPAEGAEAASEREALRKQLDEARRQGEAYARELAAVLDRGDDVTTTSAYPPPFGGPSVERLATVVKLCAGIATELRTSLVPAVREATTLRRHDVTEEQLDTLRRRLAHAHETVASLASVGELRADELATAVDLVAVAEKVGRECAALAQRGDVSLSVRGPASGEKLYTKAGAKVLAAILRELVTHAITASARGGKVEISVLAQDLTGPRVTVDDEGSPLPASARRSFLSLETHAGAYGRPSGLPIFVAAELATCVGAALELSDAPSGGLRMSLVFGKS